MATITGITPLHPAAKSGDLNEVRKLLKSGKYHVDSTDSNGQTPLHYACAAGHLDMVRWLISNFKANMVAKDKNGCIPLMTACLYGWKDVALSLVTDHLCPLDVKDDKIKKSVLHYACAGGNVSLVQSLIRDLNADITARDDENNTPLHVAALSGRKEVVSSLVKDFGCDINVRGILGRSSLHLACEKGNVGLVRSLIRDHNADIDARDNKYNTPLHVAALSGKKEVVSSLVKDFGCDINIRDSLDRSSLHLACKGGNVGLVKSLIHDHNADINARADENNTPLHVAVLNGMKEVALFLIKEVDCDINIRYPSGKTLLHRVCESGSVSLVQSLIHDYNADINARDDENSTPFQIAVLNRRKEVALFLIKEVGCDINSRDPSGKTLLHRLCESGSVSLVQPLIHDYNADTNARDNEDNTPLQVALLNGRKEVALFLIKKVGCDININIRDPSGKTLLHRVCESGSVSLVQSLIHDYNADIYARDDENNTPLHVAALYGKKEVVLSLIKLSCDITLKGSLGRSLLHQACRGGNVSLVQSLICDQNADITARDDENNTPLHVAALYGKKEVMLSLIKLGCDVTLKGSLGRSLLHQACRGGNVSLVQSLIHDHNADITARDDEYNTPFHVAALNGKREVTLFLINVKGHLGRSLLHLACEEGDVNLVQFLIRVHNANMNVRDDENNTPLHVAALSGKEEVVLSLIKLGCDITLKGSLGRSLLHQACRGGNVSLVQSLICDQNADITARDDENNTPLHVAALYGKKEIVLSLINKLGCDATLKGYLGRSLLHSACAGGYVGLVQSLIHDYNADTNARDGENNTPLHVAALNGNKEVALFLIKEFGCDINTRDPSGKTLLHRVCESGSVSLVQSLIHDYNADINARDDENNTPLHVAALYGNKEVVLFLIEDPGFDINIRGVNGYSLLHSACHNGHLNLTKALCKFMSPLIVDEDGNTPLHISSVHGHSECVETLLQHNAPILIRNASGMTPIDLATGDARLALDRYMKQNQNKIQVDYGIMQKHAKKKYSGAQRMTRVFVIGNPGAGKSTLIESLRREGFFDSLRKVSEAVVPLHTAGIIPSIHVSKHYGRVMFYDFAGDPEYYSSHAAILENLASSRKGDNIFIVVADLRKDVMAMEKLLHYWFSFIQHQKFSEKPFLIVVGSHSDSVTKEVKTKCRERFAQFHRDISESHTLVRYMEYFLFDCRKPRSKEIGRLQKKITSMISKSERYELTIEASILLGLLEKDFNNVIACSVETIVSHIEDTGVQLPNKTEILVPYLHELHEVGILLLVGEGTKDNFLIVLSISKLTNKVHEALFSLDALKEFRNSYPLDIGIIPENLLLKILPEYCTKEFLIQLQYCQEISHDNVGVFSSISQSSSSASQSLLFFPAHILGDKSDASWRTPPDNSYSIGWFASCTDPNDYFPPRFLHVLLLRMVFRFALFEPQQHQALVHTTEHMEYERFCTMWKTGVHWLSEEGVECMVELVDDSKGVVVITKSVKDRTEICISVFNDIICCVMEAKAEFCHSVRPKFYLLDSTDQSDYLDKDNLFLMSEVEKTLVSPKGKEGVRSVTKTRFMERSKLTCMRKLTHWDNLFPIDFGSVLHYLKDIVKPLYDLGIHLKISRGVLEAIEMNYPYDASRRTREVVRAWTSSSLDPPCWSHLMEALKEIDHGATAKEIEKEHSESIEQH